MATNQAIRREVNQQLNAYELSQTVEFGHLSPKMATWVLTYVQNYLDTGTFDPLAATRASYECATEESARTFGYQLMANPKVLITLNRFFGNSPEQSFLEQVEKAIYSRKLSVAQVDALKLYSNLQGWSSGIKWSGLSKPKDAAEEPSVQAFPIGAIIVQDGKKYQVKAEEIS